MIKKISKFCNFYFFISFLFFSLTEVDGTLYHRYDEEKALVWLEARFGRLKSAMLENAVVVSERLRKDGIIYKLKNFRKNFRE
jgi:hypothetical protein